MIYLSSDSSENERQLSASLLKLAQILHHALLDTVLLDNIALVHHVALLCSILANIIRARWLLFAAVRRFPARNLRFRSRKLMEKFLCARLVLQNNCYLTRLNDSYRVH